MLRGLCREYNLDFSVPDCSFVSTSRSKAKDSDRAGLLASRSASPSSSSSGSICEFHAEEDYSGATSTRSWSQIEAILNSLNTDVRVRTIMDLHASMQSSSDKAAKSLEELDLQESSIPGAAGSASSRSIEETNHVVSEELLTFDVENTEAVQALRRCIALAPQLRHKVQEKKQEQEERLKAEAKKVEQDAQEELMKAEAEERGLHREVARKLIQYGTLPYDAHPDLIAVLAAQRDEIRQTVQRIDDLGQELHVKRLALEHVDNRQKEGGVHSEEDMKQAIHIVNLEKKRILAEKMLEAEDVLREERRKSTAPTEAEVREAAEECEALAAEAQAVTQRLQKLQELTDDVAGARASTPLAQTPDPSDTPPPGASRRQRRAALVPTSQQEAPLQDISFDDTPEAHARLSQELGELEEHLVHEEKRIAYNEGIMKKAEQTLKVLEETKAIFLEYIARERPSMLKSILDVEDPESSSEDHDYEDHEDSEEEINTGDRLAELVAEERQLRMQLSRVEESLGAEPPSEELGPLPEGYTNNDDPGADDPLAGDIRRLVALIDIETQKTLEGPEESPEPLDDEDDDSGDEGQRVLSPEEAVTQLRAMPHLDLRRLLALQEENAQLLEQIRNSHRELDELRKEHGDPDTLLGGEEDNYEEAPSEAPRSLSAEGMTQSQKDMVAEVRHKCRELRALRKRWWSERQDPLCTVRRALAGEGLPEDGEEDQPPGPRHIGLFTRIHASMTLM